MAGDPVTNRRMDRRRVGAGELIEIQGRLAKVLSVNSNDAGDGLTALVQFGDGELERMRWADLALQVLDRPQGGTTPEVDSALTPLLEELPVAERERYLRIYRQLLQVNTGSQRGTPDADREAGMLDPAFDPDVTTKRQRVAALVELRRTRGEDGASQATIYRQLNKVRRYGIDGLLHGNRKLPGDLLAEHDAAIVDRIRQFLVLHKSTTHAAGMHGRRPGHTVPLRRSRHALGAALGCLPPRPVPLVGGRVRPPRAVQARANCPTDDRNRY